MKPKFLFFIFIFSNVYAFAENSCEIPQGMFQIDTYNKLILINKDINSLNSTATFPINVLELGDDDYSFNESVNIFEIGKKYEVTKGSDAYVLYFTELPIIRITTSKPKESQNPNEMVWNDPENGGNVNGYMPSSFVITESSGRTLSSNIGIRLRGALSRNFLKKSFKLNFWNDANGNSKRDVSLLEMKRNDNTWALQAMWHEPLKLGSKVSPDIWKQVNTLYYSAKEPKAINGFEIKYAEVFINNNYRGVYGVTELIDRKQLQLKKFNLNNGAFKIRGELYKPATDPTENGAMRFFTLFADTNLPETTEIDKFEYKYPEMDDETIPSNIRNKYDWSNFREFANFIVNSTEQEFNANYKSKLVISNYVDYFIFLNLLKGQDNSVKNVYYAKYDENEPYFIIPWDLDATWGTGVFGHTGDWAKAELVGIDKDKNNIYLRMYKDNSPDGFPKLIEKRWNVLRKSVITHENIKEIFKAQYDYLLKNSVYDREGLRWTDFENRKTGDWGSYQNRFNYLDQWIKDRIEFLDVKFNYNPTTAINELTDAESIQIYPNPATNYITVFGNIRDANVRIFDVNGRMVKSLKLSENNEISLSGIQDGIYFINVFNERSNIMNKIIIRR